MYKRNAAEFLEWLEEPLQRNRENSWLIIKDMIDKCVQQVNYRCWTAIGEHINNFENFELHFRNKYLSESQYILRDHICYGNDRLGDKPTTYFLGKVCLAKCLEPNMLEESLVAKVAYHFDESVPRLGLPDMLRLLLVWRSCWVNMNEKNITDGDEDEDGYIDHKPRLNDINEGERKNRTEMNNNNLLSNESSGDESFSKYQ